MATERARSARARTTKPAGAPPAETLMVHMLAAHVPMPTPELRFAAHLKRRFRFDYAWPDRMVAVEVDGATWAGGRHTRGAGYERDCEKLNLAVLLGWRVLRFTTQMVEDGRALDTIQRALVG